MAKNHSYEYCAAGTASYGAMRCAHCGKKIASGQYRMHMNYKRCEFAGYVTSHRACTEDDAGWKKADKLQAAHAKRTAGFLAACLTFRSAWNVSELDELIADLRAEA